MVDILVDFDATNQLIDVPEGMELISGNDLLRATPIPDDLDEKWCENYWLNKELGLEIFPEVGARNQDVAILVGASPAVKRNLHLLKGLDERFKIIVCNTVLKRSLDEGIEPSFVFAAEAGDHITKDFDCDTRGLSLIHTPFASPEALKKWQGQRWVYLIGGGKKFETLIRGEFPYEMLNIGGGNVLSTAMLWAYRYLGIRHFITIGMSLCYYDDYYFDGRITKSEEEKRYWEGIGAIDMYGNSVRTTIPLLVYKIWLENYLKFQLDYGGSFTNSTEDGILGVLPEVVEIDGTEVKYKAKPVPWINIMPLELAIKAHQLRMEDRKNGTTN